MPHSEACKLSTLSKRMHSTIQLYYMSLTIALSKPQQQNYLDINWIKEFGKFYTSLTYVCDASLKIDPLNGLNGVEEIADTKYLNV